MPVTQGVIQNCQHYQEHSERTLFVTPSLPSYQKSTLKLLILRRLLKISMLYKLHFKKTYNGLWPPSSQHTLVKTMTILDDPQQSWETYMFIQFTMYKNMIYIIIYTHSTPQLSPDANMSSFSNDGLRPKPPPPKGKPASHTQIFKNLCHKNNIQLFPHSFFYLTHFFLNSYTAMLYLI